jgi:hypothetical protein
MDSGNLLELVISDSMYGRNLWKLTFGIVGTDCGAEPVPECSTSRNRMYSPNDWFVFAQHFIVYSFLRVV